MQSRGHDGQDSETAQEGKLPAERDGGEPTRARLTFQLAPVYIGYEWLPECGGKTPAPAEDLSRGLDRIMELAAEARVALMCSESQPLTKHSKPRANCHRVGLLGPPLRALGARLVHILPGGGALEVDESSLPSVW